MLGIPQLVARVARALLQAEEGDTRALGLQLLGERDVSLRAHAQWPGTLIVAGRNLKMQRIFNRICLGFALIICTTMQCPVPSYSFSFLLRWIRSSRLLMSFLEIS